MPKAAKAGYTATVAIAFDISTEGNVRNVRVILSAATKEDNNNFSTRELVSLLDAEAVRFVLSSPRWTPTIKTLYNVIVRVPE